MNGTILGGVLRGILVFLLIAGSLHGFAGAQPVTSKEYGDAVALYDRGDYEEALKRFEDLYQRSRLVELRLRVGQACIKLRRFRDAREAAQDFLTQRPDAPLQNRHEAEGVIEEARLGQAAECFDRQDWACAQQEYEEAFRRSQDPTLLLRIAQVHLHRGNLDQAREAAREFLAHRPNAPKEEEWQAREVIAEARPQPDPVSTSSTPVNRRIDLVPVPSQVGQTDITTGNRPGRPLSRQWWLWTTVGLVAATAVVGGVVGWKLSQSADPCQEHALGTFCLIPK